jgi:hypothetical protein
MRMMRELMLGVGRHFSDVYSVVETPLSTPLAESAAEAARLLNGICIMDWEVLWSGSNRKDVLLQAALSI